MPQRKSTYTTKTKKTDATLFVENPQGHRSCHYKQKSTYTGAEKVEAMEGATRLDFPKKPKK